MRFIAELTVVLSVIFNTSLPCEDLHFTQYRVCERDDRSDYKKSVPYIKNTNIIRWFWVKRLCCILELLPGVNVHHGSSRQQSDAESGNAADRHLVTDLPPQKLQEGCRAAGSVHLTHWQARWHDPSFLHFSVLRKIPSLMAEERKPKRALFNTPGGSGGSCELTLAP